MVECYLCKGKLRVTRDKHVYDEKLKKRYHFKCFAGICRVCDEPVYTKTKHKTVGANVWHEKCYKMKHRHNPIKTIDDASWKAMEAARKAVNIPRKMWREFEEDWFKEHPPKFEPEKKAKYEGIRRKREGRENPRRQTIEGEEAAIQFKRDFEDTDMEEGRYDLSDPDSDASIDREARRETQEQGESEFWQDAQQAFSKGTKAFENWLKENVDTTKIDEVREKARRYFSKENPMLVTPQQETDIVGAFQRVIHGIGTEADKLMVRMAREADVVMSTGPSVLLKRKPGERGLIENPEKLDYIIQDEFGTTFETGKGTSGEAEARALHYNKKYMRSFKVIYPKTENAEVKKAAQKATKEMLKS